MVGVLLERKVSPSEDKLGEENQKVSCGEEILWPLEQVIFMCHQVISMGYVSVQRDNTSYQALKLFI